MNDRIPWLDYAAAVERAGPKPRTVYSQPVACEHCGRVRQRGRGCRCACGGELMGPAALRWMADVWRLQDYVNAAAWAMDVAEGLEKV